MGLRHGQRCQGGKASLLAMTSPTRVDRRPAIVDHEQGLLNRLFARGPRPGLSGTRTHPLFVYRPPLGVTRSITLHPD
jgi:hypothetical protein